MKTRMMPAPIAVERGRLERVDHEAVAGAAGEEGGFDCAGAAGRGGGDLSRVNWRRERRGDGGFVYLGPDVGGGVEGGHLWGWRGGLEGG